MKWSTAFIPTLREAPKEADAVSHALLLRAGCIRQLGAGTYSYLPLGYRVLAKATQIVRDEMDRCGAQECVLPAMHPVELWEQTGRLTTMRDILLKMQDHHGRWIVFGPTHEEVVTALVQGYLQSYKQLPFTLYQIQTKFRDEPRPKAGIMRSKEFLMKDAYSFHATQESLGATYQQMYDAYARIFARCGLTATPCAADSGAMGGSASHEFLAPSAAGEDWIVQCTSCDYAASLGVAEGAATVAPAAIGNDVGPHQAVSTPGKTSVADVSRLLKITPDTLIKTMLYTTTPPRTEPVVAVIIRGDHEVNEAAVARHLNVAALALADDNTIAAVSGGPKGFTGPVNVARANDVYWIVDPAVMAMSQCVAGANKADTHLTQVVPERDFPKHRVVTWARHVTEGDLCTTCQQPLQLIRAAELGHVFQLGTKYTASLDVMIQGEDSKRIPVIMGCYGIGVNRIVATAVEQSHDENGIIWPQALSPYDVNLIVLDVSDARSRQMGDHLYEQWQAQGWSVLYDERAMSAGAKFKDADLVGIPIRVVVGKRSAAAGDVELSLRHSKDKQVVPASDILRHIERLMTT